MSFSVLVRHNIVLVWIHRCSISPRWNVLAKLKARGKSEVSADRVRILIAMEVDNQGEKLGKSILVRWIFVLREGKCSETFSGVHNTDIVSPVFPRRVFTFSPDVPYVLLDE